MLYGLEILDMLRLEGGHSGSWGALRIMGGGMQDHGALGIMEGSTQDYSGRHSGSWREALRIIR